MPGRIIRHRPSPAMVVALLALTVALGGTGYAAIKLPKGSVGAKQLKRNAVTGVKVKDASLFANDFAAGQLPRGPKGDKGDPGAPGPAGAPGAAGSAIAYAHVNADATVDRAKGIAVTRGTGANAIKVYCVDHTGGGAVNAQVTPDSELSDPALAKVGLDFARADLDYYGCPQSADFFVSTDATSDVEVRRGVDMAFYVAVIG